MAIEPTCERLRAGLTRTLVVTQLVSVCAILIGIALQVALAAQRWAPERRAILRGASC